MITELELKELILKSALDVPPFMSIADFDHEVSLLHKDILKTIESKYTLVGNDYPEMGENAKVRLDAIKKGLDYLK